jgi:hypothetical protein
LPATPPEASQPANTNEEPLIFTHIGLKLGELQTPTVEFDNVNFLGWRAVYVGFGRFFYVGTRFSLHASSCISSDSTGRTVGSKSNWLRGMGYLAILALEYEVGIPTAA